MTEIQLKEATDIKQEIAKLKAYLKLNMKAEVDNATSIKVAMTGFDYFALPIGDPELYKVVKKYFKDKEADVKASITALENRFNQL